MWDFMETLCRPTYRLEIPNLFFMFRRDPPVYDSPTTLPANIFTNDGSFFEQFQKISGVKGEC